MAGTKRIAVLGISIESNRFAPVCAQRDFEEVFYAEGDRLRRALGRPGFFAFGQRMSELCEWEPVPLLVTIAGAGGPMEHGFFEQCVARIEAGLQEAGRVDGVYLYAHGGGLTTETDDLDGVYFRRVREIVGPETPMLAVLDLHGLVTTAMIDAADVLVAYRTNPHLDQAERSAEAADLMYEMFQGMRPRVAYYHLPMMAPSVTLGTGRGEPYGDLISEGQRRAEDDARIANVSILCGFNPADCAANGMHVIVTARGEQAAADALARDLAVRAWSERDRYELDLTVVDAAVDAAKAVARDGRAAPWILADVADNPGAGARGNTTALLQQLLEKAVPDVLLGLFYDPALAAEAHRSGEGARFQAHVNRDETSAFSESFVTEAEVIRLTDGRVTPTRGMLKGRTLALGPCALLAIDGVQVAVTSVRQQITSDDYFHALGADPAAFKVIVVKSRGHFRAGFDHLVPAERIIEVDCPGLATPNLHALPWTHLPRPMYPLDAAMTWEPGSPHRRPFAS